MILMGVRARRPEACSFATWGSRQIRPLCPQLHVHIAHNYMLSITVQMFTSATTLYSVLWHALQHARDISAGDTVTT